MRYIEFSSVACAPYFISFSVLATNLKMKPPDSSLIENKILNFIMMSQLKETTIFGNDTIFLITDNTLETRSMIHPISSIFGFPMVVFIDGFSFMSIKERPCYTIILLKDENGIDPILKELLLSKFIKINLPIVLVICQQVGDEEERNISAIFHRVWEYGLHRFMIIYVSDDIHARRFNPFLQDIYEVPQIKNKIFENYLKNMHRYKLRVSIFEEWPLLKKGFNFLNQRKVWIGRDIMLLDSLMKLLNATYELVEPPRKTRYKGAVRDILNNKTDFCFVRHFLATPYEGIENTFNDFANLYILVPGPQKLSQSKALFNILHIEVWMSFVISLLALGFFMKIVTYIDNLFSSKLTEIFMNIWGVFLNIAIYKIHKYKFATRISLLFWIWACLILTVSFQSRLMNLLEFIQYEKGIRSFQDLKQSKIPIYTSYNITELTGEPTLFKDQIRHINYTDIKRLLWHEKPNAAFVVSFGMIRGHVNPEIFPKNSKITHMLIPEPLCFSFAVYLFRNHSPYTKHISDRFMQLRQFGFASKGNRRNEVFEREDRGLQKLTLQQIEAPLLIWVHGIVLCLAVIIVEFVLHSPRK